MDQVITQLLRDWGTFGLIIVSLGFIIYDKFIKNIGEKGNSKQPVQQSSSVKYANTDIIYETLKDVKETIKDSLDNNVEIINSKIDNLENNFDLKIDKLERKVDEQHIAIDEQITYLDSRINNIPLENIKTLIEHEETEKIKKDYKAFDDTVRLGADIFDILVDYAKKINCTHLFIGSFHNGSYALNGIPYIKFNIIREAYNPNDVVEEDHDFEPVYRDCNLSLLGKLPKMLVQNKLLYFKIDENNDSDMFNYDSIIVRRMIGMGIKQLVLHILYDEEKPSGFIGVVKYNYDKLNLEALKMCVKELELIHNNTPSESLKIKNKNK